MPEQPERVRRRAVGKGVCVDRTETFDGVVDAINATGYGLTLGVHSRVDSTIRHILGPEADEQEIRQLARR